MDSEARNKAQVKLTERWAEADALSVDNAVRACLEHADTRKFLWWLLEQGKWGTQPFAANALITSFNCGELNVGQKIFDRIVSVDPAGFMRMQQENVDAARTRSEQLAAAGRHESDFGPSEDRGE